MLILKKIGDYEVVYTVKDSSSNEASIVRKVSVKDNEKPTFTFKNNKDRYAIIGNEIDLNDYEVIDNYDGNITDKVVVSGEVNFNKEGSNKYKLPRVRISRSTTIDAYKKLVK